VGQLAIAVRIFIPIQLISITIMPVAGWRACTREHAANSQLGKPALRYCNFQMALLNNVVHQELG